jgi:hypothetical protein
MRLHKAGGEDADAADAQQAASSVPSPRASKRPRTNAASLQQQQQQPGQESGQHPNEHDQTISDLLSNAPFQLMRMRYVSSCPHASCPFAFLNRN